MALYIKLWFHASFSLFYMLWVTEKKINRNDVAQNSSFFRYKVYVELSGKWASNTEAGRDSWTAIFRAIGRHIFGTIRDKANIITW